MLHTALFIVVGLAAGILDVAGLRRRSLLSVARLAAAVLASVGSGWAVILTIHPYEVATVSSVILAAFAACAVTLGLRLLPAAARRATLRVTAVGVVLASAFGLRFWGLPDLGYQIWDEYHYVGGARALTRNPFDFDHVTWFAPPGTSIAISWAFRLFGESAPAAIGVSALAGVLTVAVTYALAAHIFSWRAGVIAAAILSFSEFSLMYSRVALTDSLVGLFMGLSCYLVLLAFERRSLVLFLAAGLSTGVLMNLKYNGWFPVAVAAGMLAWYVVRAALRGGVRSVPAETALLVYGTLEMAGVAIALYVPWLLHVQDVVGLRALEEQISNYSVSQGPLVKTPLPVMAAYLGLFMSWPVLLAAAAGAALSIARRSAADWMLAIYTAGLVVLLMLYFPYPHLAYPLAIPIAAWAGHASDRLGGAVRRLAPAGRRAGAAVALCGLLLVASELPRLPKVVGEPTLGYERAGTLVNELHAGAPVFTAMQANCQLYIDGAINYSLDGTAPTARLLATPGRKYIVVDQTYTWDARNSQLLIDNANRLNLLERIPNPMYDEVYMEPAYTDKFGTVDHQPDLFRNIYVYWTDAALSIPENWNLPPG